MRLLYFFTVNSRLAVLRRAINRSPNFFLFGIAAAETAFFYQFHVYSTDLWAIGFSPSGEKHYVAGFVGSSESAVSDYFGLPLDPTRNNTKALYNSTLTLWQFPRFSFNPEPDLLKLDFSLVAAKFCPDCVVNNMGANPSYKAVAIGFFGGALDVWTYGQSGLIHVTGP